MKAEQRNETNNCGSSFWEKCLQTTIVTGYMAFLITGSVLGWLIWFCLLIFIPWLRIPMLAYGAWIIYDRHSCELGHRRNESFRKWKIWKYHKDYFPTKLIKTVDLPADRNYVFGAFPHGILATGTYCAFGNIYGGFHELFPKLKPWMLTLAQHFHTPFLREYVFSIGALPASATCMTRILSGPEKGNVLVLMVGGAQETFYTDPGVYKLNLKSRKGFVRIALKTGASLVPVLTFNEIEIYHQVRFKEGSLGFTIQSLVKKITGIAPVMFYGRFGLTPFRKPLFTVVGEPIDTVKTEEPTREQVEEVHAKFVEKLTALFESNKHKYIENADEVHLKIV